MISSSVRTRGRCSEGAANALSTASAANTAAVAMTVIGDAQRASATRRASARTGFLERRKLANRAAGTVLERASRLIDPSPFIVVLLFGSATE